MISMDDLPMELLYKIIEECGARYSPGLALVCRRFEVVSRMSTYWTVKRAEDLLYFLSCVCDSDRYASMIRHIQISKEHEPGKPSALAIGSILKRTNELRSFEMLYVPPLPVMHIISDALSTHPRNLTYLKLGSFGSDSVPNLTVQTMTQLVTSLPQLECFRACVVGSGYLLSDQSPTRSCPVSLKNVKLRIEDVNDAELGAIATYVCQNGTTVICSIMTRGIIRSVGGAHVEGPRITTAGLVRAFSCLPKQLRHLRIDTKPSHGAFMQELVPLYPDLRVTGLRAKGPVECLFALDDLEHLQVWIKSVSNPRWRPPPLAPSLPPQQQQHRAQVGAFEERLRRHAERLVNRIQVDPILMGEGDFGNNDTRRRRDARAASPPPPPLADAARRSNAHRADDEHLAADRVVIPVAAPVDETPARPLDAAAAEDVEMEGEIQDQRTDTADAGATSDATGTADADSSSSSSSSDDDEEEEEEEEEDEMEEQQPPSDILRGIEQVDPAELAAAYGVDVVDRSRTTRRRRVAVAINLTPATIAAAGDRAFIESLLDRLIETAPTTTTTTTATAGGGASGLSGGQGDGSGKLAKLTKLTFATADRSAMQEFKVHLNRVKAARPSLCVHIN